MTRKSYLRYRPDVGMEHRCADCRTYWPLTAEFWTMRDFVRCRACWRKYKNRLQREKYRSDAAVRERLLRYQEEYRKGAAHAKRLYSRDYYWSDPDLQRAKALDYYYRNRDAILAKKRARHAEKKAA